jgi:hypothetical protein
MDDETPAITKNSLELLVADNRRLCDLPVGEILPIFDLRDFRMIRRHTAEELRGDNQCKDEENPKRTRARRQTPRWSLVVTASTLRALRWVRA